MTELSGFRPVTQLAPNLGPQSLRVPANKTDALANASEILGALWDAVDAGLSTNVKIEVLRWNPPGADAVTMCRITPVQPDGVAATTANPGDWLAVDNTGLRGMTNDAYAAKFTQNMPIEWTATATAPVATAEAGLTASIAFPQPTSANRPFTYVVNLTDETADATTQVEPIATVDAAGNVTLPLSDLVEGHQYSVTVTVNSQYEGVTATSLATDPITATT